MFVQTLLQVAPDIVVKQIEIRRVRWYFRVLNTQGISLRKNPCIDLAA